VSALLIAHQQIIDQDLIISVLLSGKASSVPSSRQRKRDLKASKSLDGVKSFDKIVGRPREIDESTRKEILEIYWSEPISIRKIADHFGLSHMSVWRIVQNSPSPF
jgi:DNA invertase Pin-like site-specific DNA recombinase